MLKKVENTSKNYKKPPKQNQSESVTISWWQRCKSQKKANCLKMNQSILWACRCAAVKNTLLKETTNKGLGNVVPKRCSNKASQYYLLMQMTFSNLLKVFFNWSQNLAFWPNSAKFKALNWRKKSKPKKKLNPWEQSLCPRHQGVLKKLPKWCDQGQ